MSRSRIMLLAFLIGALSYSLQIRAQETQQPAHKSKVLLGEGEWKAVEGIFQSSANKDLYVEFRAKNDQLVATLLWNKNEIHLDPESALIFSSGGGERQEPVHIQFLRDSSGAVNQVNVQNNGIWNRTKNYKAVEKKEMPHTAGQLKQFEGLFELQGDETKFIELRVKDSDLVLKQQWDGNEIPFVPETLLNFFCKFNQLFTLDFSRDSLGKIDKVVAFRRDVWIKTSEKPILTIEQLKACEGKFQSVHDPDNLIQLFVNQGRLVARQLWDKKEIPLEARTNNFFYNESQSFSLIIIKNKEGVVDQIWVAGTEIFKKID